MVTPTMVLAATRPAFAAAFMRDSRPGKAMRVPMRIPAAPAMQMAKSSVLP